MHVRHVSVIGMFLACAGAISPGAALAQVKAPIGNLPLWTSQLDPTIKPPAGYAQRGTCPCPGGGLQENEAECGLPTDTTNGGCNSTPPMFGALALGQSICGTSQIGTANVRDTDWFRFTVTAVTNVEWAVTAEFPVQLLILNDICPNPTLATPTSVATGNACVPVLCQAANLAPGSYIAFVSPQQNSTFFACNTGSNAWFGSLRTFVPPPPPANDNCTSATCFVGGPGTAVTGSTTPASIDCTGCCNFGATSADVWYKYQPASSGTATFNLCGSAYDTVLSAHDSCGGASLACNDDSCGLQSSIAFPVTGGSAYFVRVSGYNGAVGNFTLTLADGPAGVACGVTAPRGACCVGPTCSSGVTQAACTAQGGRYNGDNSTCPDSTYAIAAGGGAFQSIAGSGTLLATVSGCDDCTENVTLPFSFPFYGGSYTTMAVSSNGNIQFGAAPSPAYVNDPIPSALAPNNAIYPLWDDYNPLTQGDIYVLNSGTAPNRTVTVEWNNVTQYTAGGAYPVTSETFQAVLSENGNVAFRYGTITPTLTSGIDQGTGVDASGGDRTIGVENATGTSAASTPSASFTGASQLVTRSTPTACGPVCGTADFNGDGDVGTDQDIEAFFRCLAGTCCPSCFIGGADFNGDGDVGTDQDIEAFFRVLAGNPC